MAYYLDYSSAAGKYMLMPAFTISAGQDFDFSFDYKFDNSNYGRPFGWNGSSSFLNRVLIFHSAAGNTVRITTSATNTDFTTPSYTRTDWHNFRFARASGVITCYFDGAPVGTAANNEAFTPNLMFAQASGLQQSVSCSMRNVKLSIAGAPNREYLNSVGTGSTWVDIVSGQDATQQGTWPADDSEWVFYSTGGGTVSASASYDIGAIDYAVTSTVAAPNITAALSYDIGAIDYAVASTVTVAGNAASASFDIGDINYSASVTVGVSSFAAYSIGDITYNASALASVTASAAYDIGSVEFTASASVVGDVSAAIGYDIGSVSFSVLMSVPTGEPERSLTTVNNPSWRDSIFFKQFRRH